MANLKYFDSDTNTWKTLVVGAQGPQGIQGIQGETGSGPVNAIINGGFDIWQRGTSFSHTGSSVIYMADRWGTYRAGFQSGVTSSRQASSLTGFEYSARIQRDSGNTSTNTIFLVNTFETKNSLPFAGKAVSLSFYARAGANFSPSSSTLVAKVLSGTGTDQTAWSGLTGVETVASTSSTLTTSWQRFTVSGTVPTNATQIAVSVEAAPTGTAGANDWFEITGVQLEAGSTATDFRRNANSLQGELAACQRYYQKSYNQAAAPGVGESSIIVAVQGNIANNAFYHWEQLLVTMRAAPTLRFWSLSSALTRSTNAAGGDFGANSAVGVNIRENGFSIKNQSGSTMTVVDGLIITNYDASAEL